MYAQIIQKNLNKNSKYCHTVFVQVMYFSSLFPYLVLFCFLVRGMFLKGAVDGIAHMFTPKVRLLCAHTFLNTHVIVRISRWLKIYFLETSRHISCSVSKSLLAAIFKRKCVQLKCCARHMVGLPLVVDLGYLIKFTLWFYYINHTWFCAIEGLQLCWHLFGTVHLLRD